ncbi:MAG: peptidoglycan recognition protein family protein [Planctomycetota bacterium]
MPTALKDHITRAFHQSPLAGNRSAIVWTSLLVSMTVVGGLLMLVQGSPAPRIDGLALSMPVAAQGPSRVESIYRTREDLDASRWDGIVIHHSGSTFGSPASIAEQHERSGIMGLGYHFVIGNGQGTEDGELHVGYRWLEQLPGAHSAGPEGDYYNQRYIGICLVGDGDRRPFTETQIQRLLDLTASLRQELGLPMESVRLHRDIAGVTSPGRLFPQSRFELRLAEVASDD